MDFLIRIALIAIATSSLTGCLFTYLVKSSWHQTKILKSRVPIEEALKDPNISDKIKKRLRLAVEAKEFAEKKLNLTKSDNYNSYVQLDRDHVTYVIRLAKEYELKTHMFWFPIVGELPYKGYYSEKEAKEVAASYDEAEYDTMVRGVSAYSTLGWFDDPILSSMMNYSEPTLVDTIIHETVHATLFIKGAVDFNERLATFIGREGARKFYLEREGPDSPTNRKVSLAREDDQKFSKYISKEIKDLRKWYKDNKGKITQEMKIARIKSIQTKFTKNIRPTMSTPRYGRFERMELNNAWLLSYETYVSDLSDFEKLYEKLGRDFNKLVEYCKKLEDVDDPVKTLKNYVKDVPQKVAK